MNSPYDAAFPVVCMDETPRQLIGETRKAVPAAPGRPAREDYEYRRLGTCKRVHGRRALGRAAHDQGDRTQNQDRLDALPERHRRAPPRRQADHAGHGQPQHPPPGAFYETFDPTRAKALWDRFEFVHTPKHGSWLNVAEVELNVMIRQCLNRRIDSIDILRDEVAAWQASRDSIQAKVNWQFTTDDARVKLKRLYPTLDG